MGGITVGYYMVMDMYYCDFNLRIDEWSRVGGFGDVEKHVKDIISFGTKISKLIKPSDKKTPS